jgi:outer membrane immunogenic protein
MKTTLFAMVVATAFTGPAVAADLAARPYTKAVVSAAPAYSWTGFYVSGGAGAGMWAADSNVKTTEASFVPIGTDILRDQRYGGSGWFGTVGLGYDWQLDQKWLVGVFGDGQFGDIRGSLASPAFGTEGREKLRASYAAGARIGYLVAPKVLSYLNGGYSGSEWSGTDQALIVPQATVVATTRAFRRDGWFIGGGVEHNLDIFGITAPGWFMKTEYRSAFYDRVDVPLNVLPVVGFRTVGTAITFKPWTQTISTSLVYRFN